MFDSLHFNCIFCGKPIEKQTKSGPCLLDDFKFEENLPPWLMEDLNRVEIECPHCSKRQKFIFDFVVKVKKKAIEPADNLDWIEWTAKKKGLI